ncbi:hypothetical protein [Nocardioides nanhaiensis]|uniref:Uncharacterized protein n=1 Tax=Nocardioides nanhaiensis TaxID=1476871 RepID=A0ABP8X0Q4_9ACTN
MTESSTNEQTGAGEGAGQPEFEKKLGLRPIEYRSGEQHPEQRPCPSWCGLAHDPARHGIDPRHPLSALHTPTWDLEVALSAYRGTLCAEGVLAASVEVSLEQVGQRAPRIRLIRYLNKESTVILTLGLTDAEELALALTYQVQLAEGRLL